ncbi:DASH family cryptochrome [Salinisphaera sp. G21_0]|uniref:DASH family cryptochrome n=1 Tax=Salinisphaera sp. G21_0 TaxID=2821094 RepID=UPI001ADA0489|nr:DASH family cryptochrome [Salinisphaera sp. G21_0]MBO9482210.1 DASH family cryptochrome [Salinisphaera sp. G21_0]
MQGITLFLFTNDLRLSDNRALLQAAASCKHLVCVYCVDPAWFKPGRYQSRVMGEHRWRFLREGIQQLESQLEQRRQKLLVRLQSPYQAIEQMLKAHKIDAVYRSRNMGYQESAYWQSLKQNFPAVTFNEVETFTLFHQNDLPFAPDELPETFTQFRKLVEHLPITEAATAPDIMPGPMPGLNYYSDRLPAKAKTNSPFTGGETAGAEHLKHYFSALQPTTYKETRNALQGWETSTKFSPWLAHGCLSARQIFQALRHYESLIMANESTYWIQFELLWREYFQWYALKHGARLFSSRGIRDKCRLSCFYPERFQKWCAGNTPWPIVNACMKELQATGYLSNRGRQIVASCFIHELGMDWRYGAAWFEQQLVDYDVGSNWGNWQYLAGVGADPRGSRHFNLDKQAQQFDPDGRYINRWGGHKTYPLDSVDAADWPIMP